MKSKAIRVKENTYEEILQLAEITKHQIGTIIEIAWREFKKNPKYAQLMLFANNDGE